MTQPPLGPPPPPDAPQPTGWIRFTLQGNAFTSNMLTPKVRLNGYPVPSSYGESVYPVPPGPWHVDVAAQWLRTYGQAALDVTVREGETVSVFYAPPYHQFARGNIGYEKQPRPGLGGLLLALALVLLVVVLGVVVAVV